MKIERGTVAAVTGAGSGIGRALARELARRGAHLALSDVDEAGLEETVRLIGEGHVVTSLRVDVSKREEVYRWADEVVRAHGACHLVVNNAGISYASTVEGADYEDFARVIDVNFWGVVYGTKAFLPYLRKAGHGHVVNVSSLFGIIGFPGQSAYNASKFAVRGFTECLREELEIMRSNVSTTCVHPGGIKTNIARATKTSESVRDLGVDPDGSRSAFEKQFRTSAEDAAKAILRGVERNARRVLIGADAHLVEGLQRVLPGGYQRILAGVAMRTARASGKAE